MKTKVVSSVVKSVCGPDTQPSVQNKERSIYVNAGIEELKKTGDKGSAAYKFHSLISYIPLPKSYLSRITLIIFIVGYLPILVFVYHLLASQPNDPASKLQIFGISLSFALLGLAVTAYPLKLLLSSLLVVSRALDQYINDKRMPALSTLQIDELERLTLDIQFKILDLQGHIRSLEKRSMTDYLTGTHNRYSAERQLKEDIARAQRSGNEISLIILDIDEFKLINDRYGHDVGDICLKHVVEIIEGGIRKGDWLGRWGGDEFILLLFDSDEKSSRKIVERIGAAVKEQPALTPKGEISVGLSVGICQYNGKDQAEELFKKADCALLLAKRLGKSQIVYYSNTFPIAAMHT